jgi:hypothetical protein
MVARGFLPTRTLAPAPAAPVIAFEPATLQLGELVAEAPKTVAVTLRNISARTIRITAAIANCGCTTSTFPPDPIPAGGTAEALVTVNAPPTQDESLMKSDRIAGSAAADSATNNATNYPRARSTARAAPRHLCAR